MILKKTLALLLAVFICFGAVGCTEDYKDAFIYIEFTSRPSTLDPQLANSIEELTVTRSLFDTLLRYDDEGKIVPSAAESFSKKGNTYTFNLKKDAAWTDGTPLTAHDFVFGFKRAVSPETGAPYANSLFAIKGARNINEGTLSPEKLGVSAKDDYTLTITLQTDDSEFEKVLTTSVAMPCNEDYFYSCKGKYGLTLDTTPSCGSYYVRKWTKEDKFLIRLAKNLDFEGDFEANSMRIYFTCSDKDKVDMLKNDNTDLAFLPTDLVDTVKENGYDVLSVEDTCYALCISNGIAPEIRQALMQSIEPSSYAEHLMSTQSVAESLYPNKVMVGTEKVSSYITHSKQDAATLYAQAILNQDNAAVVPLKYISGTTQQNVAKALAAHWQQTLSCFINIEEIATYSSPFSEEKSIMLVPFKSTTGTLSAYHSELGFGTVSVSDVYSALYENYLCYPLYFSSTNIGIGYKIKNLETSVHNGIIDVSRLIKQQ